MRKYFVADVLMVLLFVCVGCGGETNNGVNCRFSTTEAYAQVCANNKCSCRLDVSIQNLGTQSISGPLHYDAFNANNSKVGYVDFQVPNLTPGANTTLHNDILAADNNRPLTDCTTIATVQSTTVPDCP